MMNYVIIGLLVASVVTIGLLIAYYQNKIAQVNEKNSTLINQKKASDNDIQKYRDDLKRQVESSNMSNDDVADLLDSLRK